MMSVNYLSGGDNNVIVLNLNGDADLNTADVVDIGTVDDPDLRAPVGLHLGDGNISQPTLASITSGVDAIFINGLRMPLPIIPQVDRATARRPPRCRDRQPEWRQHRPEQHQQTQ